MLQKKDTRLVTLALLYALAAAEQPAAASTFNPVLAQTPAPTALPSPTAVPGVKKLRIASSSSMEKFNEALERRFEQQFPGQEVTIGYQDANAALRAVRQEQADLAAIGRPLTRREKARGLVEVPVARNKIAIVVGANNPFTGSLTDQQFAKIFRGEIQDWSELGGAPGRIRVIDRPETSDLRQTLREYPVFQPARFDTGANALKLTEDSTQAVIRELGTDGIGIAIADEVLNQPGIRVLAMHKTTPDDPRYPFSQRLFYVYKKTNTSAALQNFLGYATAPQGQSAIAEARTVLAQATPPATPLPATATTPGALVPAQTLTPGVTPLPETVPAQPATRPAPVASESAGTSSIPDGKVLWIWWLWISGLLLFLLWGSLKNKRSQPQSNQHLSLSSLDPIEPISPRRESYRPVSYDTPITANETKELAIATSGLATGSELSPSPPITEQVSSLVTEETPESVSQPAVIQEEPSRLASDSEIDPSPPITEQVSSLVTEETPESVSDIPEATPVSALVAGSEIPDLSDNSSSPPVALDESTSTASEPIQSTAIPSVTHPTAIATTGLVSGSDIRDTSDTQPMPSTTTVVSNIIEKPPKEEAIATSGKDIRETSDTQTVADDVAEGTAVSWNSSDAIATDAAIMATQEHREEVQAVKYDTEATENADESTIVLLSSEAEWAYAYWNIPKEKKEKLRQEGGTKLALRLYDVTDIDLNNQQPESIGENDCSEDSRDGYLTIPWRDRDYMVEIGYVTPSDRWLMLARSPVVRIPPASEEDRQLANVEFEAMQLLSVPPVSPSILSSSNGSLGVTNLLNTPENPSSVSSEKTRRSKFPLVADAELSVYGETEPDAKVTIDGRPIELNPTGTFRCQMLFPDGESESTITAVTADGEIYSIQIKFTRQTLKPNQAD